MISELDNTDQLIASQIRNVFQDSYAVEAEILKATDFPPLKRSIDDIMLSSNSFYGFYINEELTSVIEIKIEKTYIHIQSLVVNPNFFRQGIAQRLLNFTFETFHANKYVVETGIENTPAVKLYLKFGFIEVKQYDTDHGVRKVRFEKIN